MGLKYISILCFLHFDISFGVIYNLNVSEYKKLPPIYDVEPYETCFEDDNAMYCYVQVALVSDNYNPTLELIKEYSAFTTAHFNHSKLRHCICISRTCKITYNGKSLDLDRNIESCLNETFYEKYGLKTKLLDTYCVNSTTSNDMNIEFIDVVMLVVVAFILIMNFIGTMDDIRCVSVKRNYSVWARIFLNFSIRRNWNRLRASACDGPDPRIKRLRGINGLKVIALMGVIGGHSLISAVIFIDNPQDIESMFKHKAVQVIFNWTDFMQLFFMASGLLLTYNLLIISETRTLDWMMVPKGIILRWFRLTPLYAIVVLFSVSWIRFFGYGPAKHLAVMDEVTSCRKYWWMNLLYINNVFDDTTCVNQSWYIAADTQLYCFGLIVFLICMSPSRRKIVLPLLLIAGVVIPALVTYMYDLDGVLVLTPETVAQFFITDPTFNYLYKQSYTNTFNYVVGLGLGYMIYHGQQNNLSLDKYQKYRFFFWLIFPLCVAIASLGIVLYSQAPRQSILVRTLLAAFVKPVLGLVAAVGVIGIAFKYENLYRSVLEWSPFTPLARLTYSAYLLHVTIIRIMYSTYTTNSHVTSAMIQQGFYITILTFVFSVPLYLMVEQPFGQLLKVFFTLKKTKDGEEDTNIKEIDVEKKNGIENMSVA